MEAPRAFQGFVKAAPCAVITRMVLERVCDQELLSTLFQTHAVTQYDRIITIDHLVAVMLDVACGIGTSVRASFLQRQEQIGTSIEAFYRKLQRIDPETGMAVVAEVAKRLKPVIRKLAPRGREPLAGFHSLILDGNMLAGSEHRLKPLRKTRAAALPGKSLVLYEAATGLVTQTVLCQDAYTQERALLHDFEIPEGKHLIADRNFCVLWFLEEVQRRKSWFTIRHHQQFTLPEGLHERRIGKCKTGMVYERKWERNAADGRSVVWRIIRIELDEPTEDGDTEITLISNLPAEVNARKIAEAYQYRWTIEGHFQRLTDHLHCELPSLGEPRAALFAFAMSLVAGNVLAVVIAAIAAGKGKDLAENLSYYYLVDEVAGNYRGMMIALPDENWSFVRELNIPNFAQLLKHIASHANAKILRKTTRGPKKPRRTPNCTNIRHLSTKRLLDQHR